MSTSDLVEFLSKAPATELLLFVSFATFAYFTLYAVFDGNPPIFKKKTMSAAGRRLALIYGLAAISVFLLTLLVPVAFQLVFPSTTFFVNDVEVTLGDNVSAVLIDKEGKTLSDSFAVRPASWHTKTVIPVVSGGYGVYKGKLKLMGYYDRKRQSLDSNSIGPLQVSGEHKKVSGPLELEDESESVLFSLDLNNEGRVIFPEAGIVEITDAQIHYQGSDGPVTVDIGPQLDLERYTTRGHDELFKQKMKKESQQCLHLNDAFKDKTTSSNRIYNPDAIVGTSSSYPEGTFLEIDVPYKDVEPVNVEIIGHNQHNDCVLSTGVFKALQLTPGTMSLNTRVVDYRYKVERQSSPLKEN